ncbi:DNA-protecting protein DprA [candidate division GN15 bacterium]|uniref:DNA-protecting protein DprA n=1 Tax=candidate division GN15 bacterium TaxID=2072418 RepID=A0A855X472_9BACT|nr:MAG: DNA-protecting protein DprA [candidate division GN15 bacterium]
MTDIIALLSVPGIGKGRYRRLVAQFGSPSAVLSARPSELEAVPGISSALALAVRKDADIQSAQDMAARIAKLGWAILTPESSEFPPLLKELPDGPVLLFRMGEPTPDDARLVAIVGTRHPSEKGKRFCKALSTELAQAGVTVVSGMAEGIDSAAHAGALEGGGKTIAIWGTSLDIVYPSGNRALAQKILANGAVYSEYLPGTGPEKAYFPERNRIISGMCEATIVVEAGLKSGALITADAALNQGRDLFAVPGSPDAAMSVGTNHLIKKGARLLTSVRDLFDELPRLTGKIVAKQFAAMPDLTDGERQMVDLLADGPMQLDHLSRLTNLPVSDLMSFLLALELKGVVQELSGKRFALNAGTV